MSGEERVYAVSMAPLEVVPLEGGKVSLRVTLPERLVVMTLGQEEVVELAVQLMAAAAGRLQS